MDHTQNWIGDESIHADLSGWLFMVIVSSKQSALQSMCMGTSLFADQEKVNSIDTREKLTYVQ